MMSAASRTLVETSQSDLNARTAGVGGSMGPPNGQVKHKMTGCTYGPSRFDLAWQGRED